MANHRTYNRTSIRTLVTVLTDDERGRYRPKVFKSWTEDISASGMQIVCHEELPEGKIYVRILLPDLEGKIVECSVVRSGRRKSNTLLKDHGPRYVYGVQFLSVQPLSQFEEKFTPSRPSREPANAVG